MNKFFNSAIMLATAASAMVITSCSHDTEYYNPNKAIERYEKNWQTEFGEIDPNQDWNAASSRVADITVDGTAKVRIHTGNPYLYEGALAAEFTVNSQGTFNFDLPETSNCVYFVLMDDEGGYQDVKTAYIEDNTFTVDFTAASAAGAKSFVTRAAVEPTKMTTTKAEYFTKLYYDQWGYGLWENSTKYYNKWDDKYYNVSHDISEEPTIDQSLLAAIKEVIPENKKSPYYERIIKDVDLIVSEAGPVKLTVASATTSNQAAIGYYIYTDKAVDNSLVCPVTNEWLTEQGYTSNQNQYTIEYSPTEDAQKLADKFIIIPNVQNFKETTKDGSTTGKTISLVYPNGDGTYSDEFPADTKIAFFVVPNASYNESNNSIDVQRTVFSFADMNVDAHKTAGYNYYSNFNESNYATSHAATFRLENKIIIGFEDAGVYNGDDFDYNDCVFILDGNFEEKEIPTPKEEEETEGQKWMIACEDLGSSADYDFNDVVFTIEHVSGSDSLKLTPMAAGGVLGSNIYFNDKLVGEIHDLIGNTTKDKNGYMMLNTRSGSEYCPGPGETKTLTDVPADFSISENMGGFAIQVSDSTSWAQTITGPTGGTVPQMILIEGSTWKWPREFLVIHAAYPNFKNWTSEDNLDWYNYPTEDKPEEKIYGWGE